MMRSLLMLPVLSLFATAALAGPAEEKPPASPCGHSGMQMQIAGMDLAELRCRPLVDDQYISEIHRALRAAETSRQVVLGDLAAEKADRAQRDKDMTTWFKAYFAAPAAEK